MTMSLDGFVADESGSANLYPDLAPLRGTEYMAAMIEETGAVLMGKRTFEMADNPDWYVGNYEYQVPISSSPTDHRRSCRSRANT
jgi:hypothetical protein